MKLLDEEQKIREQIFEYFGYVEDWRVLPFDDSRGYYWGIDPEIDQVCFAAHKENVFERTLEDGYRNETYKQRHLSKWIYRGPEYTMVVVDTCTDGNQFLQILDNSKEIKKPGDQDDQAFSPIHLRLGP